MKKQILLIGVIAITALGIFLSSCAKEETVGSSRFKGCICTIKYYDGDNEKITITAEDIEDEGMDIATCRELQNYLLGGTYEAENVKDITCKGL